MALSSMTGFARAEGSYNGLSWAWELRSVNGRNLDVRCRLPGGMEALDQKVRTRLAERLKRGNVQVNLQWARDAGAAELRLNEKALAQVIAALDAARVRMPQAQPPRLDGLLQIRGVLEPAEPEESEETREAREAALLASFEEALESLAAARRAEGAKLEDMLATHIDRIEELAGAAAANAETQPEALRERLRAQVFELLQTTNAISEERLVQEVALLVTKADVREEIDRLRAHVAAARGHLADSKPVGRKLDFLTQEFHREANTLCSKSPGLELTRIGLDLKATVDQLREQVQNVE
jgi:uncharacterized protein (TIGR00255 family)